MSSGHCRWTTARPAAGLLILALGRLCGADCTGASCAATGASLLALKAETTAASLGDLEERGYPINMTVNGSNGTVDTQLEMIVGENAEQDMKEMNSIPNPENASSNGTHGMGELARNLEFLMLKIVQLETVVEMQQHEIQDLAVSCPGLVPDHMLMWQFLPSMPRARVSDQARLFGRETCKACLPKLLKSFACPGPPQRHRRALRLGSQ